MCSSSRPSIYPTPLFRASFGHVVVAQLLALQLDERGERARHRVQVAVERAALVRVLAVAQVGDLDEGAVGLAREHAAGAVVAERGEIVADRSEERRVGKE